MLLHEILDLFCNPLNNEQTWAVGYTLTKAISEFISANYSRRTGLRIHLTLDDVDLSKDGGIHLLSVELASKTRQSEQDILSSIGDILCHCLQYGLNEDKLDCLSLDEDIAEFVGRLLFQEKLDLDEGFDDRSITGSLCSTTMMGMRNHKNPFNTLDDTMCFCEARLVRKNINSGLKHYENVCRALFSEAMELRTFLKQVCTSSRECGEPPLDSVDKIREYEQLKQWSKLWLTVVREIREGQRTRSNVRDIKHCPYELSPSETLFRDLLTETECLQKEKDFMALPTNARDMVLNFLVGRAKKSKVKDKGTVERRLSADGESTRATVRRGSGHLKLELSQLNSNQSDGDSGDNNGLSFVSADSTVEHKSSKLERSPESPRKVLHVPTPLKFENWLDQPDNVMLVKESGDKSCELAGVKDTNHNLMGMDDHHPVDGDKEVSSERIVPQPLTRAKKKLCISATCLTEIDIEDGSEANSKRGASFIEICKTRQEITRAETEAIDSSHVLSLDIKYGRVCFGCRKTKFGFLRKSRACEICRKKFCSHCMLFNNELPRHLVDFTAHTTPVQSNLIKSKNLSLSLGNLNYTGSITPFPCRGQSVYDIGWKKTSAGPQLHLCKDCKSFVDSILTETRNSRWQVRLQLEL